MEAFNYFDALQKLQENNTDHHLDQLFQFVAKDEECIKTNATYLRVAALLTGINKPDHYQYFKLLSQKMQKEKIAQTVFLPARDCPTVRAAIGVLVSTISNNGHKQIGEWQNVNNFKAHSIHKYPIDRFDFRRMMRGKMFRLQKMQWSIVFITVAVMMTI